MESATSLNHIPLFILIGVVLIVLSVPQCSTLNNDILLLNENDTQTTIIDDQIINETSTAFDTLTPSTAGSVSETTKGNGSQNRWDCGCWNSTDEELVCKCEGPILVGIPQRLHCSMDQLIIGSAGLQLLRTSGLRIYSKSLKDITLIDLMEFDGIEPGALATVTHLRTLYISHAPKLQYLSAEVFKDVSDTFKTLRINYCGLLTIPDLQLIPSKIILHLVDLEGNRIVDIKERSVKMKTIQLILDNNAIQFVRKEAFNGSQIAKLSMKGNTNLKRVDRMAFVGILNIQELDLSSTSLEELPTNGLDGLEILRIQDTHSLKTIPSVYNFKSLRVAWLTHSFHCCAFKYPSRHDPSRHQQRLNHLAGLQQACIDKGFTSTVFKPTVPTDGSTPQDYGDYDSGQDMWDNGSSSSSSSSRSIRSNSRARRSIDDNDSNSLNLIVTDSEFHSSWSEDSREINPSILNSNQSFFERAEKILLSNGYSQSITGAPLAMQDKLYNGNSGSYSQNIDLGEFHDTTANISSNTLLDAICGNLTQDIIDVKCFPIPDALNPCEDVMGSHWLRASVWIVVFFAVVGNVAVLVVLFANNSDLTVPKFLMSNLAFADLCMGLYLTLIASIDAHSMGEYFNFAFDWQYGSGCKAAGFLTVFASHLSVFTLTIITLERWVAITYALYLNRRIQLKAAANIMVGGWIYSIVIASFPLFGVSNYSSTSICLPMEARDSWDVVYLVGMLAINGLAFLIVVISYAQIYFSLQKETREAARHASTGEMTVAKKMSLLVFTNFACWAPIAFFGLTAIAGYPLIDVAKSKILLVFFYPLNSCANPYLYAILTAQYRKDLFMLLAKFGFCNERATQYKLTYSMPTNHTYPMSLIGRNSLTNAQRKSSRGHDHQDEAFV